MVGVDASRTCQKRAWVDPEVPHRDICQTIQNIYKSTRIPREHDLIVQEEEAMKIWDRMFNLPTEKNTRNLRGLICKLDRYATHNATSCIQPVKAM
jgi:hypothetical protein